MSDAHNEHENLIKTPKQLIAAIVAAFVIPIFIIVLLVQYVGGAPKVGAGSTSQTPEAIAARIKPVADVGYTLVDASAPHQLKSGTEVYNAACVACHGAGVAGAPKFGDVAAWAPRIKTGFEALWNSALKGKNAMGPQGGGDFSDVEIGRAVVHMTGSAGGKFAEPAAPAPLAAAK